MPGSSIHSSFVRECGRVRVAVCAAAVLAGATGAIAQQATTPASPQVFRAGVDLVHLDISVLDADRRPVRGLTPADFTLLEDGRPQTIAAFSEIDVPDRAAPPPAAWMRDLAPDVRTNEEANNPESRLFVVLIDDAMLPPDPAMADAARRIARSVIDRMSPVDQVAIVFSEGSRGAQSFTSNRTRLLAAVETLTTGSATYALGWDTAMKTPPGDWVPGLDGDIRLRAASFQTLRMVADTLIAAPQRRKALFFVSPGINIDLAAHAQPRLIRQNSGSAGAMLSANASLVNELPELYRAMRRANVTIYPIDPGGLGGLQNYLTDAALRLRPLRDAKVPVPTPENFLAPTRPPLPNELVRYFTVNHLDMLQMTASNSGGVALVHTNDFEPGLARIFQENDAYYLVGYSPAPTNRPGSEHRLTVRVNRPGVTVRTRSGYTTPGPDSLAESASPLAAAIAGPVPAGPLSLRLAVAPVARAGLRDSAVTVIAALEPPAVNAAAHETLHLEARAFTPDGYARGAPQRQTATFARVPGASNTYEWLTSLTLPPGRYQIRVAAHREADGASGSVFADVEIPEFSARGLALSGIWFESSGAPTPIPRDGLSGLVPTIPTAAREFTASDRVAAFFRISQGGEAPLAPVSLSVRIVNDRDVRVVDAHGVVGVERFNASTRTADHRFGLPVANLPAGEYALTFEAGLGETMARRDVRFTVAPGRTISPRQ